MAGATGGSQPPPPTNVITDEDKEKFSEMSGYTSETAKAAFASDTAFPTLGENLENLGGFYNAISTQIANRFYFYYKYVKFMNAISPYNSGYEPASPAVAGTVYAPLRLDIVKKIMGTSRLSGDNPSGIAGMLSFLIDDKKVSLFPGYTPVGGVSNEAFFSNLNNRSSFDSIFSEFGKRADRSIELANHFLNTGFVVEDIANIYSDIFFQNTNPLSAICGIKILAESFRDVNVMQTVFERYVTYRDDDEELSKGTVGGIDWFEGAALDASSRNQVDNAIASDDEEQFNSVSSLPGNKYGREIVSPDTTNCFAIGDLFLRIRELSSAIPFSDSFVDNFGNLSQIEFELYALALCAIISETVHYAIDSRTDTNADSAFIIFDVDQLGTMKTQLSKITGREVTDFYGFGFSNLPDSNVGTHLRSFAKAHLQRVDRIKKCVEFLTLMKDKMSKTAELVSSFRSIQNSGNLLQEGEISLIQQYATREYVSSAYANLTKYSNFSRSFRRNDAKKMTFRSSLTGFDDDDLNRIISLFKDSSLGLPGDVNKTNNRIVTVGIPVGTMESIRRKGANQFDCYTDGSFVEINFYNLNAELIAQSLRDRENLQLVPFQTFLVNTTVSHTGFRKVIDQNTIQSARNSVLDDGPVFLESLSRNKFFSGLTSNSFDSILQTEYFCYYKPNTVNEDRVFVNKSFSSFISDKFDIFGEICNVVDPGIALRNELISATLKKYLAITSGVNMIEPNFPIISVDRLNNNFFNLQGKINADAEQIIAKITDLNSRKEIPDSVFTRIGQEIVNSNIYARRESLRKIIVPSNFEKIYAFPIRVSHEGDFPLGSIFVDIRVVS